MFEHLDTHGFMFMGAMTLIFAAMLVLSVINGLPVFKAEWELTKASRKIHYIRDLGLLALVVGVLGQLNILYGAFKAIEAAGDITPGLVYEALRTSLTTTMYGAIIYITSFLIWLGLSLRLR
ncbi:MAG: MotA/TolQ/ExbB proton channel family protein [Imperialibacter sp.]|uniref:MotA/TolQ/ExbB proton channel family protein n=1 Tax=Imperialibacter sp. TaxID=2038411 RepID=UPI0032EDFF6C